MRACVNAWTAFFMLFVMCADVCACVCECVRERMKWCVRCILSFLCNVCECACMEVHMRMREMNARIRVVCVCICVQACVLTCEGKSVRVRRRACPNAYTKGGACAWEYVHVQMQVLVCAAFFMHFMK